MWQPPSGVSRRPVAEGTPDLWRTKDLIFVQLNKYCWASLQSSEWDSPWRHTGELERCCVRFSGLRVKGRECRQRNRLVPPCRPVVAHREDSSRRSGKSEQSSPKTLAIVQKLPRVRAGEWLGVERGIRYCVPALVLSLFCCHKRQYSPTSISSVRGKGGHRTRGHSCSVPFAVPIPSCLECLCPDQSTYSA